MSPIDFDAKFEFALHPSGGNSAAKRREDISRWFELNRLDPHAT